MDYDPNLLEHLAQQFALDKDYPSAIAIYLHMATGDPSLDAGHLGWKFGECYEAFGDRHAAKYWHDRAVEEGAGVRVESQKALAPLADVTIDALVKKAK